MLNGLDLFSGGGGLADGLHQWVRPVAYCEIDRGAQRVLLSRMARGELPAAPIWDDVSSLRGCDIPPVDIIAGGFPCQDISLAGTGKGLDGGRSGLVFEYLRIVGECRPRFVFMENVPALSVRGLDRVLLGLSALGYDARWTIVSAAEMGAPHTRERIWILAHANGERSGVQRQAVGQHDVGLGKSNPIVNKYGHSEQMANPDVIRGGTRRSWRDAWRRFPNAFGTRSEWPSDIPKPSLCRGDDGLADRVNRLRILGNGVVPVCASEAFQRLMGI